jgi:hypothetical protein
MSRTQLGNNSIVHARSGQHCMILRSRARIGNSARLSQHTHGAGPPLEGHADKSLTTCTVIRDFTGGTSTAKSAHHSSSFTLQQFSLLIQRIFAPSFLLRLDVLQPPGEPDKWCEPELRQSDSFRQGDHHEQTHRARRCTGRNPRESDLQDSC